MKIQGMFTELSNVKCKLPLHENNPLNSMLPHQQQHCSANRIVSGQQSLLPSIFSPEHGSGRHLPQKRNQRACGGVSAVVDLPMQTTFILLQFRGLMSMQGVELKQGYGSQITQSKSQQAVP